MIRKIRFRILLFNLLLINCILLFIIIIENKYWIRVDGYRNGNLFGEEDIWMLVKGGNCW